MLFSTMITLEFRMRDQGSELGWRTAGELLIELLPEKKLTRNLINRSPKP